MVVVVVVGGGGQHTFFCSQVTSNPPMVASLSGPNIETAGGGNVEVVVGGGAEDWHFKVPVPARASAAYHASTATPSACDLACRDDAAPRAYWASTPVMKMPNITIATSVDTI